MSFSNTSEILLFAILVALFTAIYVLYNIWGDNNYWQYRSRLEKKRKLKSNDLSNLEEVLGKYESESTYVKTFAVGFVLSLTFSSVLVWVLKFFFI